jgi:predicted house-cleaning noncanonical NTP pyrophosphatase (MazG superfamily)
MAIKLVRDNTPEWLTKNGDPRQHQCGRATDHEGYASLLRAKLQEEVDEYLEVPSEEGLADILEVVYTLSMNLHATPLTELDSIRRKKARERGGFREGITLG